MATGPPPPPLWKNSARTYVPLPKNAGRTGTSQRPNSKRRGSKAAGNSSIRTAKRTSKLSVNRINERYRHQLHAAPRSPGFDRRREAFCHVKLTDERRSGEIGPL